MKQDFSKIEQYRVRHAAAATNTGDLCGWFIIPFRGRQLKVCATNGENFFPQWEHVSVSLKNRCPNWNEMCFVKSLFWNDEETVVQFHPCKSEYINNHEYCLHLWKRAGCAHELPPSIYVGIKPGEQCQ